MGGLRAAVRALLRDPYFSLLLVLPLALGIGVNAGLIGVVDSLLLRPLPGIASPNLFWVSAVEQPGARPAGISYDELRALEDRAGVFDAVAGFRPMSFNLESGGEAERVPGQAVAGNYFQVLGVKPAAGRWFGSHGTPGASDAPSVVVSYDFWQRRYGGNPSALGRTLGLNGITCTIAGVAPEGFVGVTMADRPPQVWAPAPLLARTPLEAGLLASRDSGPFEGIARLKTGVSAAAAGAVLRGFAVRSSAELSGSRRLAAFVLSPLRGSSHPSDRGDVAALAGVAFAISGIVLLISCANAAALLLGRAATRAREIGIRLALGAGRARIVRQLLAESFLVALAAGLVALLLAWWTTRALVVWLGVPFPLGVSPDLPTLAGTLGVSAAAAVLFGLVPALHATGRGGLAAAVGSSGAGATRSGSRLRQAFAASQIALSLALLGSAGVLVQSVRTGLAAAGADDRASKIVAASLDPAAQGYSADRQRAFVSELVDRVVNLPGVQSCSLSTSQAGRSPWYMPVAAGDAPSRPLLAAVTSVWPAYFQTLGMPIVRGRDISIADRAGSPPVAVVNEAFAGERWPGEEPLGKTLRTGPAAYTVVGVVREGEARSRGDASRPGVFFARQQLTTGRFPWVLIVRTSGPAEALLPSLRQLIRGMDPALPLFDVSTLEQVRRERLLPRLAASRAVNVFGAVALLLAALGVYGLVSWRTARRQRELGIRIALGATRGGVLRAVMADGGRLAATGGAAGAAMAAASARLMSGLVGGPAMPDLPMLAAVVTLVVAVVLAASYFPARRATRLNPSEVLRAE